MVYMVGVNSNLDPTESLQVLHHRIDKFSWVEYDILYMIITNDLINANSWHICTLDSFGAWT